MSLKSTLHIRKVFQTADAASLYEATKFFAKMHGCPANQEYIGVTSQTIMRDMLAQTQNTPPEDLQDMRSRREKAIEEFLYIYGGYIAYHLQKNWEKDGLQEIAVKKELLYIATKQILFSLRRNLLEKGYKKGTFSHLIHMAIKNKSKDVKSKYFTWIKKNPTQDISFENAEDIIGGVIEIFDDHEFEKINVNEEELEAAGILQILKKVKTKNSADDYNMFILCRVKNYKLKDIAEKFEISIPTASRRINDFADAALKLCRQYLKNVENL